MRPAGISQIVAFFYRPQGRIGRLEYALGLGFIYAINLAVLAFFLSRPPEVTQPALPLVMILGIPLTVAAIIIMVKRCHDLGLPGSFVLLLLVPILGFVWMVALLFIPGNPASNPYGAPPAYTS